MDKLELKAEVFKVIRANQDKSSKSIMKLIREHLPEATDNDIRDVLIELSDQ